MTLPKQNPTNQNQPQNSVAKSAPENKDTSQLETLLGLMAELNLVNSGSKSEESTNNSDNVVAEKLDSSEKSSSGREELKEVSLFDSSLGKNNEVKNSPSAQKKNRKNCS
jgi:hypothetical protein